MLESSLSNTLGNINEPPLTREEDTGMLLEEVVGEVGDTVEEFLVRLLT